MTRRWLILAACVAVAALGAASWMFVGGLSADEQRLVGTWRLLDRNSVETTYKTVFALDRRFWYQLLDGPSPLTPPTGSWRIDSGATLVLDYEPNSIRRSMRPVGRLIGLRVGATIRYPVEVGADRLTIVGLDGSRLVYTRDRAD